MEENSVEVFITNSSEAKGPSGKATGGEAKQKASDSRAEELGNPVEDSTEESDVATNEGTEGHSRVDVATGDVGTNRNSDKKSEGVCYGGCNQASWGACAIVGELVWLEAEKLTRLELGKY
jgi:hypothetical protein